MSLEWESLEGVALGYQPLLSQLPWLPNREEQAYISEQLTLRLFSAAGLEIEPAEIGRTIYGKPQIRYRHDCIWNYNIASTGSITVGVLGMRAIGIDVEAEDRRIQAAPELLLQRMFRTEQDAAACLERWDLIQLWTIKEAVLKAKGYGLSGGLLNVAIDPLSGSAWLFGQRYSLTTLRSRNCLITIAEEEVQG
ncbi:4'-phosphopantetheinyl transferase superfamily protein [Synechococcus sp. M16CYN]|uniref:4'-phosphopantetheinyl transferase family protein n=1 Tax=Synechococcus sp. M16CYN TaxID=3103139 RepID=UPI0032480F07